jgi:phage recombination protein Bet
MSNQLAVLTQNLATRLGMNDGSNLTDTLKSTAFKGQQVTDSQMVALLVVANQYSLNPFTREIFAFPDKGGIVPVVGVDGWARIINSDPNFDGMEFAQDEDSCTCVIFRKDRSHPIKVTEWMSECNRQTAPWKSHPKRMLRHKAMIQGARLAFGFVGIYDEDEAERIRTSDPNTPGRQVRDPVALDAANKPEGYDDFEAKNLPALVDASFHGMEALTEAFTNIPGGPNKKALWKAHSNDLKRVASQTIDSETGEVVS